MIDGIAARQNQKDSRGKGECEEHIKLYDFNEKWEDFIYGGSTAVDVYRILSSG